MIVREHVKWRQGVGLVQLPWKSRKGEQMFGDKYPHNVPYRIVFLDAPCSCLISLHHGGSEKTRIFSESALLFVRLAQPLLS